MNKINFLAAALLACLISCKDKSEDVAPKQDETPDSKTPTATIAVQSESEKLWNKVNVVVDASVEEGEIASVALYANGDWVGNDEAAPYEFEWDTKSVNDGPVELKAVVMDGEEKTTDFIKGVEVMNTLIDYKLYDGYLAMDPTYKYFTYITSKSKQVLYYSQIEELPFKEKVMRPDDFNDAEFDVHFTFANPTTGYLTTYTDVTPGVFYPVNDDKKGAETGESQMKFTDIPDHDYFTYVGYSGLALNDANTYDVTLYENLSAGYLYLRDGETGLYAIMDKLTDGADETSLSVTSFEMEKHTLKISDPLKGFNLQVRGHVGPGVDDPSLRLFGHFNFSEQAGYEVVYHTPDNEELFDHYSTFLSINTGGKSYQNESYFDLISSPVKKNVTFGVGSYKLSDIQLAVSGDSYDVLVSSYSLINDGFFFTWECHSSSEENLEFPVIPTKLTAAFAKYNNTNLGFKDASVYVKVDDFDHLDGYAQYLNTLSGRTGKTMKDGGAFKASVGQSFAAE